MKDMYVTRFCRPLRICDMVLTPSGLGLVAEIKGSAVRVAFDSGKRYGTYPRGMLMLCNDAVRMGIR